MYAIDVDGVIIDSSVQLCIDTYNTYRQFWKTSLFDNQLLTLKNYKAIFAKNQALIKNMLKFFVYTKCAQEYVYTLSLLDQKIKVKDDEEFRTILKKHQQHHTAWNKEFYKQRYQFQKAKGWEEVIKPYPQMLKFMKKIKYVILSNKDLKTISLMLSHFNIAYKKDQIYSQDITIEKNKKLKMIKDRYNLQYPQIKFIDDNYTNIIEAQPLGVSCYMAAWGFNDEVQRIKAKGKGIKVINLDELPQ